MKANQWTACPACERRELKRWCERGNYHLVRCGDCGLVFVREIVPFGVLEGCYKGKSCDTHLEQEAEIHKHCHRILDQIEGSGIPGREMLDIGCGSGLFLEVARERGFVGVGIEADSRRVAWCRSRGMHVIQGWFPNPDIEPDTYDLVWASHILEHVQYPREFVREIARVLKPGGVLCVLTPNAKSIAARICKCHHRYVIPPEHLTYWSARSLNRLLTGCGFTPERIYSRKGRFQLKEVLAYVLKWQFARKPSPMPSRVPFAANKSKATGFLYRTVMAFSSFASPIMERFGGDELLGLFRKPSGAE